MNVQNIASIPSLPFLIAIVIASIIPGDPADADTRTLDIGWRSVAGTNVAGYTIHVSSDAGEFLDAIDVGLPAVESGVMRATITLDADLEHRVAIATHDESGFVSALSSELTIPSGMPPSSLYDRAGQLVFERLLELRFEFGETSREPEIGALYKDVQLVQDGLKAGTRVLSCDFYGSGEKRGIMLSRLFEDDPTTSQNVPQGLLLGLQEPETSDRVVFSHAIAGWDSPSGANQDSRPACGDLDGDGMAELVIGFGAGSYNVMHIFDDITSNFGEYESEGRVVGLRQVPSRTLQQGGNGATRPAIGDIDGDGLGEVVIAFEGEAGYSQLMILDDTEHSFSPHPSPSLANGLLDIKSSRIPADFAGLVLPLLFDLDGDGRDEIIVAFAQESELILQIFDDAQAGFAVMY